MGSDVVCCKASSVGPFSFGALAVTRVEAGVVGGVPIAGTPSELKPGRSSSPTSASTHRNSVATNAIQLNRAGFNASL